MLEFEDNLVPHVVVVGAGVSGCACAARLAALGMKVTVISSSLDVVGLPGYGPEVRPTRGGLSEIMETLGLLPEGLRWAWVKSCAVAESGGPVVVDRRAVSVETKRALETMPGLEFRQGLVVELRVGSETADVVGAGGRPAEPLEVETAFGEVFCADAVVLALGLALGGRIEIGEHVLQGGRYGEVPADALRDGLLALGLELREEETVVGTRFAQAGTVVRPLVGVSPPVAGGVLPSEGEAPLLVGQALPCIGGDPACDGLARWESRRLMPLSCAMRFTGGSRGGVIWPSEYPPAPYWTPGLCGNQVFFPTGPHESGGPQGRRERGILAPDGGLTAEYLVPDGGLTAEHYASPEVAAAVVGDAARDGRCGRDENSVRAGDETRDLGLGQGPWDGVTRPGHRIRALVVAGADEDGRVGGLQEPALMERVRVAGRLAGAYGYLGSLRSGVAVADGLAAFLTKRSDAVAGRAAAVGGAEEHGVAGDDEP